MKDALPLPQAIDTQWTIGIVASLYHQDLIDPMIKQATSILLKAGLKEKNISVHAAPGSFEIPLIGSALAATKKFDALIAFGVIIEGQTHHAELLARETARGIMDVQLDYHIPFAFEILYVDFAMLGMDMLVNQAAKFRLMTGGDGRVPPVGDTVDVGTASWSNTIGDPDLSAVWTDPDFDPALRAFYYARVIEIPTPRWTAYDQVRFGIKMGSEVPMKHQERAWTSPIWYTP